MAAMKAGFPNGRNRKSPPAQIFARHNYAFVSCASIRLPTKQETENNWREKKVLNKKVNHSENGLGCRNFSLV
jgi:hypothetical protein